MSQFHFGSIQTKEVQANDLLKEKSLNSTLVQFKLTTGQLCEIIDILSLNSTLVQFKLIIGLVIYPEGKDNLSQFHFGSIQTI